MSAFPNGVRAEGSRALTLDEIKSYAPAVLADTQHDSRSQRYVYIDSTAVMRVLEDAGFLPVEVRQGRSRDVTRREFTKHAVRFRHRDYLEGQQAGGSVYEVIMKNAHDGSNAYTFLGGMFRFLCLNGMYVSNGMVTDVHVTHSGNRERILEGVVTASLAVIEQAPKVLEAVNSWAKINLLPAEQQIMAEAAHELRFADADGTVNTPVKPAQLLHARRVGDQGDDLWSTYNRIQENATKGGLAAPGRLPNGRLVNRTTRGINGIDQDIKLNRALWAVAEKMAALKA